MNLMERVLQAFERELHGKPALLCRAPGRINLIGEHTDYNQGLAMPSAIDRGVAVALRLRNDGELHLRSLDFDDALSLRELPSPGDPTLRLAHSWRSYAVGAITCFLERFLPPQSRAPGLDLLIAGDVPPGAGLSSSAATEMAILNALAAAFALDLDPLDLCRAGQAVEHRFIGVQSGLLDQIASQLSRPGELLIVDFQDLSTTRVPGALPSWVWLVVDSGVRRALSHSGYGQRVQECAEILRLLRRHDPSARSLRDSGPEFLSWVDTELGRTHAARLRHVLSENARVGSFAEAWSAMDANRAGEILLDSHRSLRDDYAVSCPELDLLVELASDHEGCAGARMMGGGFGGCTLNLVSSGSVADFQQEISARYASKTQRAPAVHAFRLAGGPRVVRL